MSESDDIDKLLLNAAVETTVDNPPHINNTMKEKLIHVVVSGKSTQFLGKRFTSKQIEQLNDDETQKLYARYEAVLGGLITKTLKLQICGLYSRVVNSICPAFNYKVDDMMGLIANLNEGPFIDIALSSLTCKLYHDYGFLLAPIETAIITSNHISARQPESKPGLKSDSQLEQKDSIDDN